MQYNQVGPMQSTKKTLLQHLTEVHTGKYDHDIVVKKPTQLTFYLSLSIAYPAIRRKKTTQAIVMQRMHRTIRWEYPFRLQETTGTCNTWELQTG